MGELKDMANKYLLIPHLKILNANAASSPYIIGFPAMTAWIGAVHALERNIQSAGFESVKLPKVGVVCHDFDLRVYEGANHVNHIIGKKHPLNKTGKMDGIIEEPFCHVETSLLIEIEGLADENDLAFEKVVASKLLSMRVASGDVLKTKRCFEHIRVYTVDEDGDVTARRLRGMLMPGYALVDASELMEREDGKDSIDTLLDVIQKKKPSSGWVVPITVGFRDLSGAIEVSNQRTYDVEHHFAEPICTTGKFVMPYRFEKLEDMMWHYEYDEPQGLYMCKN